MAFMFFIYILKEYFAVVFVLCIWKRGKWPKNRVFWICCENLVIKFFWIWSIKKVYINCSNSILGKNLDPEIWVNCRIFKSTKSLERNNEKAWFFAYWYRFMKIKSWVKNNGLGMVKTGCEHSGFRTLKLAVSQEGINNGIN